jgi:NAD(P)-dependent dehydrogenase (short-subunit alcohol dehydrogenase family)
MDQRTAIVTGGNSGLGYQCAKAIAADPNWHVVIACRDREQADQAVRALISETSNPQIDAMVMNLASLTSIRQFAVDFSGRQLPPLRAIVANAGTQAVGDPTYTEEGFETTFGVNHLGHFLLIHLLLQSLVSPARIVVVSSGTHDPNTPEGRITPPCYQAPELLAHPGLELSGIQRYTTSKLCNLLFTYELARRLEAEGYSMPHHPMTVNGFDPGGVPGTRLTREYHPASRFILNSILPYFLPLLKRLKVNINDVGTSGQAMARLVLDPELETVSGKYFQGTVETQSSEESYDRDKSAELWNFSVAAVKLTPNETILQINQPTV